MNFVLRPWQLFFLIQIIDPGGEVGQEIGEVQCRERLRRHAPVLLPRRSVRPLRLPCLPVRFPVSLRPALAILTDIPCPGRVTDHIFSISAGNRVVLAA